METWAETLDRDGFALTTAQALWPAFEPDLIEIRQTVLDLIAAGPASGRKAFFIKLNKKLDIGKDALKRLGEAMTPAASRYGQQPMRLYRGDMYWAPPVMSAVRQDSQRWHRDREAPVIFKVFWLLSDVDETCGPTEYVRGSHRGRLADLCGSQGYAGPEITVPESGIVRGVGPADTCVVCDTGGIHRGGFGTGGQRVLVMWTWLPEGNRLKSVI